MQNRTPTHITPQPFDPVPRRARFDGWTPQRQRDFIDALADTGSVRSACAAVNMSQVGAYYLRRQPGAESFAAAWDAALDHRIAMLRGAVMERAIHGTVVPVMSFGKKVGERVIHSDRLATFMLRNYDGRMSSGAGGVRLHHRKAIEEAVAKARAEWEAEQRQAGEHALEMLKAKLDALAAGDPERGDGTV